MKIAKILSILVAVVFVASACAPKANPTAAPAPATAAPAKAFGEAACGL